MKLTSLLGVWTSARHHCAVEPEPARIDQPSLLESAPEPTLLLALDDEGHVDFELAPVAQRLRANHSSASNSRLETPDSRLAT
eukprot:2942283-Rhodomonas_salina.1